MKQIYDNKDIGEAIDKSFDAGIKEGFRRCREQMMEKAVETEVVFRVTGHGLLPAITFLVDDYYKEGDKVKVIVIPEEK